MLDLDAIRKRNDGQPEGYWKATTTALCDEVERLRRTPDIDRLLAQKIWPAQDHSERITAWNEAIQACRKIIREAHGQIAQDRPLPDPSLDAIRRMLDDGVPVPPWLVRGLVERVELAEAEAAVNKAATECMHDYIRLLDVVYTWDRAIDRCDGIVAAEEALRETVKELRS